MPTIGAGRIAPGSGTVDYGTTTTTAATAVPAATVATGAIATATAVAVNGRNLGAGAGLFAGVNGAGSLLLDFKSLVAGPGLTVSADATSVTLSATGGGGGDVSFDRIAAHLLPDAGGIRQIGAESRRWKAAFLSDALSIGAATALTGASLATGTVTAEAVTAGALRLGIRTLSPDGAGTVGIDGDFAASGTLRAAALTVDGALDHGGDYRNTAAAAAFRFDGAATLGTVRVTGASALGDVAVSGALTASNPVFGGITGAQTLAAATATLGALRVADPILLNADLDTPVQDAGLLVNRGPLETQAMWRWNEPSRAWTPNGGDLANIGTLTAANLAVATSARFGAVAYPVSLTGLSGRVMTVNPNEDGFDFHPPDALQGPVGPAGLGVDTVRVDGAGRLLLTMTDTSTINAGSVAGPQGPQGAPGVSVSAAGLTAGRLVLTLTDSTVFDLGEVVGPPGPAGTGIAAATVNGDGHLVLELTDRASLDAGSVLGPAGEAGPPGPAGLGVDAAAISGGRLLLTLSDATTLDAGSVQPAILAGANATVTTGADGATLGMALTWTSDVDAARAQIARATLKAAVEAAQTVVAAPATEVSFEDGAFVILRHGADIDRFAVTDVPSLPDTAVRITIHRVKDDSDTERALVWGDGFRFAGPPALDPSPGGVNVFTGHTVDGGLTWWMEQNR